MGLRPGGARWPDLSPRLETRGPVDRKPPSGLQPLLTERGGGPAGAPPALRACASLPPPRHMAGEGWPFAPPTPTVPILVKNGGGARHTHAVTLRDLGANPAAEATS